ncbi:MAG: hypothetical protein D6795_04120 [Deltaproteobacteria bacterium]|nr:MAG: hypothetical protein D6795_04120 [Deltaproteobacteria bacterium]
MRGLLPSCHRSRALFRIEPLEFLLDDAAGFLEDLVRPLEDAISDERQHLHIARDPILRLEPLHVAGNLFVGHVEHEEEDPVPVVFGEFRVDHPHDVGAIDAVGEVEDLNRQGGGGILVTVHLRDLAVFLVLPGGGLLRPSPLRHGEGGGQPHRHEEGPEKNEHHHKRISSHGETSLLWSERGSGNPRLTDSGRESAGDPKVASSY